MIDDERYNKIIQRFQYESESHERTQRLVLLEIESLKKEITLIFKILSFKIKALAFAMMGIGVGLICHIISHYL